MLFDDTIDMIDIFMKAVIAEFIKNSEKN
jgi:hypothetical protein